MDDGGVVERGDVGTARDELLAHARKLAFGQFPMLVVPGRDPAAARPVEDQQHEVAVLSVLADRNVSFGMRPGYVLNVRWRMS